MTPTRPSFLWTVLLAGLALTGPALPGHAQDMTFEIESNLRAAVAKIDITPPPGTPIAGHVRKYNGVRGALHGDFPGTGAYAAIKVHKILSVGCGAPVRYHFSPAREHDSRHLQIDESWRGYGLLADLAYASVAHLRACNTYEVRFVIRLKENWKPKVDYIARGQVTQEFFPGTDLDALLEAETLVLDGRAIDADVLVNQQLAAGEIDIVRAGAEIEIDRAGLANICQRLAQRASATVVGVGDGD